ncbi:PRC-barrel domain-containing protein [Streptomyces sp. NPDC005925]|uniref:PRC-barrel domain-containing protein n=1 Tax=Streptomyces sp. NPDC005925 TaxID=3157172 RepID=UPI0033C18600
MDELMAARSLPTRPAVTLAGDAVAHIREAVFDGRAERIAGFTLSGLGLLSGSLEHGLPWSAVHSLGHDAVMIGDLRQLVRPDVVAAYGGPLRGRIVGARVRTHDGDEVGTVLDVIVAGGTSGRVVGFRVAVRGQRLFAALSGHRRRAVYLPRGGAVAMSGRTLLVESGVRRFTADDLASFAVRVAAFHQSRKDSPS